MTGRPKTIMNNQANPSDDARLSALLRASRPLTELPAGFHSAVWRRIERATSRRGAAQPFEWLDIAAAWLVRPRFALAGIAALLVIGASIGLMQGSSLANELAKQRYIAAVGPHSAH
jgi:hypothetical protein